MTAKLVADLRRHALDDCEYEAEAFGKEAFELHVASHAATLIETQEGLLREALSLLDRLVPHIDAIVCYASNMDEHAPNRIAFDTRQLHGKLRKQANGK